MLPAIDVLCAVGTLLGQLFGKTNKASRGKPRQHKMTIWATFLFLFLQILGLSISLLVPLSRSNLKRYFQASICKTRSTWNLEEEDHKYFMEPHLAIITQSGSICTIQFLYFCQRKTWKHWIILSNQFSFLDLFLIVNCETLVIFYGQKELIDYLSTWAHRKN